MKAYERLLRYIGFDTASDEESETTPSTPCQFDLARALEEEMRQLSAWVAGLKDGSGNVIGPSVPLHVTRFFPAFHMTDRQPTAVRLVRRLAVVAAERLEHVYTGNC